MKTIASIDVLGEETPFLRRVVVDSVCVLVAGVLVGAALVATGLVAWSGTGMTWLLACVATVASFFVHELVHGALFKLLGGSDVHVSFGVVTGMLYTDAHGATLPRGRFVVVLLGPAVLVTLALLVGGVALGCPLEGWVAAMLHLSGCTGDTGMVREILACPEATHVRDTHTGIDLLA